MAHHRCPTDDIQWECDEPDPCSWTRMLGERASCPACQLAVVGISYHRRKHPDPRAPRADPDAPAAD